jgi:thioredoxin-related protein
MSKEAARKKLEQKPVMVLFFMTGCPHCERNKPAWDEAKEKMQGKIRVEEIEANETPEETGVSSFPTMVLYKKKGKPKMIAGAQTSGGAILKGLGLSTKSGLNPRGRSTRRRNRKLRHRTRRNYVTLV